MVIEKDVVAATRFPSHGAARARTSHIIHTKPQDDPIFYASTHIIAARATYVPQLVLGLRALRRRRANAAYPAGGPNMPPRVAQFGAGVPGGRPVVSQGHPAPHRCVRRRRGGAEKEAQN